MRPAIRFDPHASWSAAQRQLTRLFSGCETAALDARLLLCVALGIDHTALVRDSDRPIGAAATRIAELAQRRASGEPVSRILGRREFWGLEFGIGPAVLDPRPETEVLVETVIEAFAARREAALRILDLGIGSGAILGALLGHFPNAFGIGIDVSEAACQVARGNLKRHRLRARAGIFCGNWGDALGGRFDVIVANPPYVASRDLAGLAPEVRAYDPRLALNGGEDGYAAYRRIVPSLGRLAAPESLVAFEVGAGQADGVASLLASAGLANPATRSDLAGHARVVVAHYPP
jgi:release factor glutamine methyltransferase